MTRRASFGPRASCLTPVTYVNDVGVRTRVDVCVRGCVTTARAHSV